MPNDLGRLGQIEVIKAIASDPAVQAYMRNLGLRIVASAVRAPSRPSPPPPRIVQAFLPAIEALGVGVKDGLTQFLLPRFLGAVGVGALIGGVVGRVTKRCPSR